MAGKHRRVRRPGVPSADPAPQLPPSVEPPTPAAEDRPAAWGDGDEGNDERLKRDKPPHWG